MSTHVRTIGAGKPLSVADVRWSLLHSGVVEDLQHGGLAQAEVGSDGPARGAGFIVLDHVGTDAVVESGPGPGLAPGPRLPTG